LLTVRNDRADRTIQWSIAVAVIGVAMVSYEHAYALVRAHGGWMVRLIPLTVDGLIWSGCAVMLDSARRAMPAPARARWTPGLGIAAMLAIGERVVGDRLWHAAPP
jgi:hypothetical protein